MAKKRTKPTPAGPPTWFPTLENLPPFDTVRVPPEHVETWLEEIIQFAEQPATQTTYRELCLRQQRLAHTIASWDWGRESSHQLIWWGVAHGSLRHGLDIFLPPPYNALPLAVRQWLYAHAFLVQESQAIPQLKRIMAMWLAAPAVGAELSKRATQHVGTPAGVLLFVHDLIRLTETDPMTLDQDISAVADRAIEQLRSRTWRKAAARIRKALPTTPGHEQTTILDAHLSGAIWETITKKWGHLQGLDALARSLDGGCNIAPTAVTDRMMKQDRMRELFPFLEERANLRLPADEDGVVLVQRSDDERDYKPSRITLSITEEDDVHTNSRGKQAEEVLEKFRQRYPGHEEGIGLLLSDEPLKELATARNVTVQTIINRKNRAWKELKRFAMGDHVIEEGGTPRPR